MFSNIETKTNKWHLVQINPNELIYTTEPNQLNYINRRDSLKKVYTLTLFFNGVYQLRGTVATIKVHSSEHAIEQEIHTIYLSGTDNSELERELNKINL